MSREWHHVAQLADLPRRGAVLRSVAGHDLVVIKSPSGFHALRNVCPHQSAPICGGTVTGTYLPSRPGELRYGLEGEVIRCPWHGWEFDVRNGEALFGTTSKRAVTYPVEVREGERWVYISAR